MLALTPGFPLGDRAHRPAIVDTLAELARDHDVEVHALRPPPDEPGAHVYRGLRVVGYGAGSKAVRFASLVRAVAPRRARFDVVWALWVDRTGPAALALGRLFDKPVVLSVMGGELADLTHLDYGWSRTPLRRRGMALMLGRAARITVGSEVLARRVAELAPAARAHTRVTPVGTPPLEARAPRVRGHDDRAIALVAISDTSPVKRPELLVDVLAALVARGLDATLELFGETSPARVDVVRAHAETRGVAERLVLRGFVEPEVLWSELDRFDVLVHASAHESQGCALVEAALAALPIATTAVGVARELEARGVAIEVVDDARAEALADAVLRARRRGATSAARDAVLARWSVDAAARGFARVLEEAVSGDPG